MCVVLVFTIHGNIVPHCFQDNNDYVYDQMDSKVQPIQHFNAQRTTDALQSEDSPGSSETEVCTSIVGSRQYMLNKTVVLRLLWALA